MPENSKDHKFCVDYGAQINVRAEICPSCGIRQPLAATLSIPPPENVSNWWYLPPLFFGILGGAIGFFGVRSRDPGKATNILVVGVISTIVVWLILL